MDAKLADRAVVASRDGYQISRADIRADRPAILDLIARNEPTAPAQRDQLIWHLDRNPHGYGRAWLLLKNPDSKPVGVVFAVPRRMLVAGEIRPVARMWTMAVEKEHRTLGPAIMLMKSALSDLQSEVDFVWAIPHNVNSTNLLGRSGFRKMARLERRVRVLCSNDYLERIVQPVAPRLSRLVVPLIAPVADFLAGLVIDRGRPRAPDLEAVCVSGFDQRFDELWARARCRYQFTTERSTEFLGWRFRRSWDSYLTLGFQEKSSRRLVGYAVVSAEDRMPTLYDFFLEDPAALTSPALLLLVDWLRKRAFRCLIVLHVGSPDLQRALADRWFVQRDTKDPKASTRAKRGPSGSSATDSNEFTVMGAVSPKRPIDLPDVGSWHFTLADDL